jgi:hypothetical protein
MTEKEKMIAGTITMLETRHCEAMPKKPVSPIERLEYRITKKLDIIAEIDKVPELTCTSSLRFIAIMVIILVAATMFILM